MSQTISVDLSPVIRRLEVVNDNITQVNQQVFVVSQQGEQTRSRLEQFYQEFVAYVTADALRTELQLAETRLVKVRQELDQRFGHYSDVRRRVTGILQATDVAIVRQETMRTATEELMLAAPRYWLAPSLVALTAWISDNQPLAERALGEALNRDGNKTALFFALVCRRAKRPRALLNWLGRYFLLQNPQALDREVIVMLDAVSNGVFGSTAQEVCLRVSSGWIQELEQAGSFLDEQRRRWSEALDARTPKVGADEFSTLRRHSPTWPRLESALAAARRNGQVANYFSKLFEGEIPVLPQLETAVDDLLDSLVTHFDDEELPLRKEDRLLELIVKEQGDRNAASRRMAAEDEAFAETMPFSALLTNAAMHPEASQASRATQRYAVAVSKDWILMGHRDLVARDRAAVPAEIELAIGPWSGKSRDGANEADLVTSLESYYQSQIDQAVQAVGLGAAFIFAIIGALFGVLVLFQGSWLFGLLLLAVAGGLFYMAKKNQETAREKARQQIGAERDSALRILRACLAELVDLRRAWASADAEADAVAEVLESIHSDQHLLRRPEEARAILS
jgi:hypothetical protein